MIKFRLVFLLIFFFLNTLNVLSQSLDSIRVIKEENLIKRIDSNNISKIIKDSEDILNGYINLNQTWKGYKVGNEIDWEINPFNNPSWQNYFYSLRMLALLSEGYNNSKNIEFLQKGKEILWSWDENHDSYSLLKAKGELIWNDHATSNRIINLIHFLAYLQYSNNLDEKTYKIIYNHLLLNLEWLYDDKNYTWGNHAVMMNRSLIYASYILNTPVNERWREKALSRLRSTLKDLVSESGVSTENSPQYHPFMMDLIKDIIDLMESFGDLPPQELYESYHKMKDYLVYLNKPNLVYPFVGDTYPLKGKIKFSEKYSSPYLTYVDSHGLLGEKPLYTDVIYKDAGYAIFRDKWRDHDNFNRTTYINFVNGFLTRVHKHSDNLSFTLYSDKEDILVDPGNSGYSKNDTITYLKSTKAHNTFTVNQTDFNNYPLQSARIEDFQINDAYSYVSGSFTPSPFQQFSRTLIYLKPNYIIIRDKVRSLIPINSYSQIFNLGLNYRISKLKRGNYIKAKSKRNLLKITQLQEGFILNRYNGSNGVRGTYAIGSELNSRGNQIEFLKTLQSPDKNFQNITLLEIKNDLSGNQKNLEVDIIDNTIRINYQNFKGEKESITIQDTLNTFQDFSKYLALSQNFKLEGRNELSQFNIEELYILKWMDDEYSLILKLNESTTNESIVDFTLEIQAKSKLSERHDLSTYSKYKKRDYDAWILRPDRVIDTEYGKFININISTKLKDLKALRFLIYDRKKYNGTIWHYSIANPNLDHNNNISLKY